MIQVQAMLFPLVLLLPFAAFLLPWHCCARARAGVQRDAALEDYGVLGWRHALVRPLLRQARRYNLLLGANFGETLSRNIVDVVRKFWCVGTIIATSRLPATSRTTALVFFCYACCAFRRDVVFISSSCFILCSVLALSCSGACAWRGAELRGS